MSQNGSEKTNFFEQPGEYSIEVFPDKNRIKYVFSGDLKRKEHIPKYIEHTRQAIEKVKPGYTLMSHVTAKGAPGLNASTDLKESLKILKSKNVLGTAVILDPKKVLQRMTLNVVAKMSGMNVKVFTVYEEAEAWLDEITQSSS